MDFPDLLLVLIGLALAGGTFVLAGMHHRREHALRDRFAEEYDRTSHNRREWDRHF